MLLIQPTEEMSKQIRMELNENVATRDKDVEVIKEWLSKQPHLPQFDGNCISIDIAFDESTCFEISACTYIYAYATISRRNILKI